MIHVIHKTFNGCVDIPDYKVKEHIQKKKTLRAVNEEETQYMDLTPKMLEKPVLKSEPFVSKYYPDQSYRLYSYKWIPKKVEKETEEQVFKKYVY